MPIQILGLFFGTSIIFSGELAHAIPPPDVIFNFVSQIPQMIATGAIIAATGFGFCYQFLRTALLALSRKEKAVLTFALIAGSTLIAVSVTYYIDVHEQEQAYAAWHQAELEKSEARFQAELAEPTPALGAIPESSAESSPDSTLEVVLDSEALAVNQPPEVAKGRAKKGRLATTPDQAPRVVNPSEFFTNNLKLPLVATNDDLNVAIANNENIEILDAREDIEWDIGHHPKAKHIRFADLRAGADENLAKDRFVFVFCVTALRGSEVAEFLRHRGITARYLKDGALGWVKSGGAWIGHTKLRKAYHEPQHQKILKRNEVKRLIKDGAIFVDVRAKEKFEAGHPDGAVHISTLHTPTKEMEAMFAQLPEKSTVILLCDDHWSSFDAFVTGIELEKRGHKYMGRFDQLDEYK